MSYLRAKMAWIVRAWEGSKRFLPVLFVWTFLSTAVTLVYPLVFREVLEKLRTLSEQRTGGAALQSEVRTLTWLLLAVAAARFLAGFYPAWRAWVNSRIEWLVREHYFARVMDKGHRFFTRFRTGDIVTRLTDDIAGYPKIAWFCCSGWFRALDSFSRVAFCLAVMLWLDRSLALWSLLPVPLMIGVYLLLKSQLSQAVEDQRASASKTSDALEAFFSGVTVVQAHNAESRLGGALSVQLAERAGHELRLAQLWVLFSVFFQALNVVGQLVVVVVGGLRVLDGTLDLGTFFAFYLYLGLLLAPMRFRRALGYVPQTPILFSASVRENVLLGREADEARLEQALRLAGLWDEVQDLPEGLDHELGLRGTGLSGGQRQRLTIARALYGEPKLLLLDDLTAALDAENEERFWEAVLAKWPDLTVLAATHREATARRMDRRIELAQGRPV
ncbi:MAG TPA: hypothetical protein DEA08_30840 [Planctomycetes bacterium]|nr:hypothetical protein [Planctomycetota bacterium]